MTSKVKTLAGVKATPELLSLLAECITKSSNMAENNPNFPNEQASTVMNAKTPLPLEEAKTLLKSRSNDDVISLQVVRAMSSVCGADSAKKLDQALSQTNLMYSVPTQEETAERKKFLKRMDRLKLRAEEVQYMKLTDNLDTSVADDVTTKSMTYAASVGLNMIVAPISFGVFMYFFAGAIFGWILGDDARELKPHETDIKSVIAGKGRLCRSAFSSSYTYTHNSSPSFSRNQWCRNAFHRNDFVCHSYS